MYEAPESERDLDSRPWCLLVSSRLLSFVPSALQVTRLLPSPDQVVSEVRPRPSTAQCPACGLASRKIHSVYRRVLADLPWQGRPVSIRVAARRFRCPNRICSRQTFAERLSGVMELSSRRTGRLSDLQRHLVLALGGEAGSRLAGRLAIPTSPEDAPLYRRRPSGVSPQSRGSADSTIKYVRMA